MATFDIFKFMENCVLMMLFCFIFFIFYFFFFFFFFFTSSRCHDRCSRRKCHRFPLLLCQCFFCRFCGRRVDASARLTLTLCHGFSLSPFFPFQHQALPGRHFRHWVPLHCSTSLVEDYGDQWSANSVHSVLTTTHHQAAFATVTEAGIGRIARRFAGQAVFLFLHGTGLLAASGS